ncbi:hypothetical protein DFJ77DRAFT_219261 [Powellomyces hirtus]|nr:hypothetical protein DFJ77DRAFT_219261 [Powellomyces hirtus]
MHLTTILALSSLLPTSVLAQVQPSTPSTSSSSSRCASLKSALDTSLDAAAESTNALIKQKSPRITTQSQANAEILVLAKGFCGPFRAPHSEILQCSPSDLGFKNKEERMFWNENFHQCWEGDFVNVAKRNEMFVQSDPRDGKKSPRFYYVDVATSTTASPTLPTGPVKPAAAAEPKATAAAAPASELIESSSISRWSSAGSSILISLSVSGGVAAAMLLP